MRIIFAALLGAAVAMPSLASEAPSVADPTDAAASVPTETTPSVTESYKAFQDKPVRSWRDLNDAVAVPAKKSGMGGMAGMSGMDRLNKAPASVESGSEGSMGGGMKQQGMAGMSHSQKSSKAGSPSKTGTSDSKQKGQMNHGGMGE